MTENLPRFVGECRVCNGSGLTFSVMEESKLRLGDRELSNVTFICVHGAERVTLGELQNGN